MSKASQYAAVIAQTTALHKLEFRVTPAGDHVAEVLPSGFLSIGYRAPMQADVAIRFAHWILDTFSDDKGGEGT